MPDESVGPEILELIERHVNSVGHLEVLILMYQNRDRTWTPETVSEELRTNVFYAQRQLEDLTKSGLLEKHQNTQSEFYKYHSSPPSDWDRTIEKVIELYRSRKVTIIDAIYSRSMGNVKSFADAFVIKKD